MPSAAQFMGVSSGLIISQSFFATYMLSSIMPYGFCWKCLLGVMPVSCLCIMVLLLLWLLFVNNSSRYYARCVHAIMLLPELLSAVVFLALSYTSKMAYDLYMWLSLCQWLSLSLSLFFFFSVCSLFVWAMILFNNKVELSWATSIFA